MIARYAQIHCKVCRSGTWICPLVKKTTASERVSPFSTIQNKRWEQEFTYSAEKGWPVSHPSSVLWFPKEIALMGSRSHPLRPFASVEWLGFPRRERCTGSVCRGDVSGECWREARVGSGLEAGG